MFFINLRNNKIKDKCFNDSEKIDVDYIKTNIDILETFSTVKVIPVSSVLQYHLLYLYVHYEQSNVKI